MESWTHVYLVDDAVVGPVPALLGVHLGAGRLRLRGLRLQLLGHLHLLLQQRRLAEHVQVLGAARRLGGNLRPPHRRGQRTLGRQGAVRKGRPGKICLF